VPRTRLRRLPIGIEANGHCLAKATTRCGWRRDYSVGSGLRFGKGKAELGIEAAYPLNADPTHGESKDPRINLSVSLGL